MRMTAGPRAEDDDPPLADTLGYARDLLSRRWPMLAAVTILVAIIGALLISSVPPSYTATARIRLDPSRNPLAGNAQAQRSELTPEAIETEVSAIRSLELATGIARSFGLFADPDFTATLDPAAVRSLAVPAAVLSHLSVDRAALAFVLDVRFTAADPVKAATLANAFADGYIERRTQGKLGHAARQSAWFQQRLEELGREASAAETRAAEFRAATGIIEGGSGAGLGTITDQQVAPLASNLASAESDAAAARSNLAAARIQVAHGGLDAVSEVLGSAVIADLRRQRAETLRSRREVDARYGERHPESIRVRDQLAALDSQLEAESRRVIGALQASAAATDARAASLRGALDRLEQERARSTRDSVAAAALEREAAAKRALYDRMSQLSLDSMQNARLAMAQAEVIERAEPPLQPAAPDRPILYALALFGGVIAGSVTILALDMVGGGFASVEQIQRRLGLPVLATVPAVGRGLNPLDLMLERPTVMFAESFRVALAALGRGGGGTRRDATPQVIAIASSLPAEGKSTSAIALARTLALTGTRTLLVDCDTRRASVRQMVRARAPGAGLLEVLRDKAALDDAIQPGDVAGLDHLLVARPSAAGGELLRNGRMEELLATLRARYDHVVLDLPPLVGLADGRLLAAMADATVLVIKWNSTPVAAAVSAVEWLRHDGGHPVGVLFTQVDPATRAAGGMHRYAKRYASYYPAD